MLGIPYSCTLSMYDKKVMNGMLDIKRNHTEYVNAFYSLRGIAPEHNHEIESYIRNISTYLREHLRCYRKLEAIVRKGTLTIICPFMVLPSGSASNIIKMGKYYDGIIVNELALAEKKLRYLRTRKLRSMSVP